MFEHFRKRLSSKDQRTQSVVRNATLSVITKGANIVASLLIVPLTIHYINPTEYGIWLTISGIVGWVYFFDLGLGNGFRNRFAEAVAKNDQHLAKQYVSTTYCAITAIVSLIFIALIIANHWIDWASILHLPLQYKDTLQKVFAILIFFTCFNMVVSIFGTLLTADQRVGMASLIQGVGQYLMLGAIFLLTIFTKGSLVNLAIYYAAVPAITMLVVSIIMFRFSRYRIYAPSWKDVRFDLIRNILSLGGQFFIIYLCIIAIFQIINIIITRELGATSVTEYNIANRYFGLIYAVFSLILAPIWSAFTDAHTKKDFSWMRSTLLKIERIWFVLIALGIVMLLISPWAYSIWIGTSVSVSWLLSSTMLGFILCQSLAAIYMHLLNGLGTIRIQLTLYILFALIAWPLMSWSTHRWGIQAVVLIPTLVYLAQAAFGKIQINKYLKGTASGWWSK